MSPWVSYSLCVSVPMSNLRRWRSRSTEIFQVWTTHSLASVETWCLEHQVSYFTQRIKICQRVEKKKSMSSFSLAAPDSATSAGSCLVTYSNDLLSSPKPLPGSGWSRHGYESPTLRARNRTETTGDRPFALPGWLPEDWSLPKEKMVLRLINYHTRFPHELVALDTNS